MAPSKRFTTAHWAPNTTHSRSSSASSFEDSYLYRTYVPLSNLPTPPLTSASTTRQQSPDFIPPGEIADPELFGPATHLTNLIPSSTSLTSPSIPLVQSMLSRANLPLETIALAVCILDSLDSYFAICFRKNCPLTPPPFPFIPYTEPHIDAIHPELLILAALVLAVKFVDDAQVSTGWYVREWGRDLWTCAQVNFCQTALMENIGWRLKPLWEEGIISEALRDMSMAGQQFHPLFFVDEDWETTQGEKNTISGERLTLNDLKAEETILGFGNVMTPVTNQ